MESNDGTRYPAWAVVRDARNRSTLTVESLATLTEIPVERIVAIESADVSPTADELFLIVRECGFELRVTVEMPDEQRRVHAQRALRRDATERIAANTSGVQTFAAFRNAQRT